MHKQLLMRVSILCKINENNIFKFKFNDYRDYYFSMEQVFGNTKMHFKTCMNFAHKHTQEK